MPCNMKLFADLSYEDPKLKQSNYYRMTTGVKTPATTAKLVADMTVRPAFRGATALGLSTLNKQGFTPAPGVQQALLGSEPVQPMGQQVKRWADLGVLAAKKLETPEQQKQTGLLPALRRFPAVGAAALIGGTAEAIGFDPMVGGEEGAAKVGEEIIARETPKAFEGLSGLTTKIIEKLKGHTEVSKQFISDLTNMGDVKQVERDMIHGVLDAHLGESVDVNQFAKKVQDELLPLRRNVKSLGVDDAPDIFGDFPGTLRYESISLPSEVRGNVANYNEHVYESPIKTSAGGVHFGSDAPNYFGHTRVEDMADGTTRRVIEVQSDLYQKGGLEKESRRLGIANIAEEKTGYSPFRLADIKERQDAIAKLEQYSDPTAHFRMVREEVKKAAEDGKSVLQFPTGDTAMKVEGLGSAGQKSFQLNGSDLKPEHLKIGTVVSQGRPVGGGHVYSGNDWVVTDVLGDGKFKAVPKDMWMEKPTGMDRHAYEQSMETFDISGKVDTENPIYKFYEKDLGKYLRSKYGASLTTDENGVKWWSVNIKPEHKGPVEAFGLIPAVGLGLPNKKTTSKRKQPPGKT